MDSFILALLVVLPYITDAWPYDEAFADRNFHPTKRQEAGCVGKFPPTIFSLESIFYIKIEYALYTPDPHGPNSTTMTSEVANQANGISTGCSFMRVMMDNGEYPDDSKDWHPCLDRTLDVDGQQVTVGTSTRFDWDSWSLAVKQSWTCGNGCVILSD